MSDRNVVFPNPTQLSKSGVKERICRLFGHRFGKWKRMIGAGYSRRCLCGHIWLRFPQSYPVRDKFKERA
jgi:hypothetical protein